MNAIRLIAVTAAASLSCAALAGPLDQLRGKMKEGLYEYKMTMDIPGMPAGMQKAPHTFQHCVTQKDIEDGGFGKGGQQGRMPENCEIKDFKMSGNTATYTMECKGDNAMRADNKLTFGDGNFTMDMKMQMTRQGQVMNMTQHMEGRHLGACKSS